jgi:spermidine/putrescine-binding protein
MGVAGAAGCHRDRRPRLNVFNWSSYIGPDTIPAFEREFGVRVRYAVYESNEEMLARVMSGNSGWDVVFPSSYLIEPMREYELVSQLDHARLPNLHHLDPLFQKPVWDADLRWGVPYMWNATGVSCSVFE